MADTIQERSGSLVETHKGYNPRILVFYGIIGILLFVLGSGLAYRQLLTSDMYSERERFQNQRRVLIPGPRGNIYDREGRLLVGNRARFALVLYLDELRPDFLAKYREIRRNYRESGEKDTPSTSQLWRIARFNVVNGYAQEITRIIGRDVSIDSTDLQNHFYQRLLLPFTVVEDLTPNQYARLIELLPVKSPLQVYTSSTRYYPYGKAAAHALGYVVTNSDIETDSELPGEGLTTFKMKGTVGRDGIEKRYDEHLEGETGGFVFEVDPSGYRVQPPIAEQRPVQGNNLTVSIDIDLQLAAEKAIQLDAGGLKGAAVALDARTGEVLVMASNPSFDLNDFTPRLSHAKAQEISDTGAWANRATTGIYPPGSSFKILVSQAGLRAGTIQPDSTVECTGTYRVGGRIFVCNNHRDRGTITFPQAIQKSCNTFFYEYGIATGIEKIHAEAENFHLTEPTGIDLPETGRMLIGDPAWKKRTRSQSWYPGDTANTSIGQGFVGVTPLQMACFVASVGRNEFQTVPHMLHDPARPLQHTPSIGLAPPLRAALLDGMERVVGPGGTGRFAAIDGIRIGGKTGTAQVRTAQGTIELGWFICFAPIENPEIAIAVMMEGDDPGDSTGGGRFAAPVGRAIMAKYFEKKGIKVAPLF